MNHCLSRIRIELVIHGDSSKVFQPGERALHNPSERQHGEFLRRLVRTENNGKLRPELLAYGIGQFLPLVSAISTDTVMDIRLMNHHAHRKAKYINHNVFLAPHPFLKHAFQLPLVEVVEDGVVGREVLGQHTPLAACLQYVHDGVHDISEGALALSVLQIKNIFGNLSLPISKAGWILAHSFIMI